MGIIVYVVDVWLGLCLIGCAFFVMVWWRLFVTYVLVGIGMMVFVCVSCMMGYFMRRINGGKEKNLV